jgi:hypothetical protein
MAKKIRVNVIKNKNGSASCRFFYKKDYSLFKIRIFSLVHFVRFYIHNHVHAHLIY